MRKILIVFIALILSILATEFTLRFGGKVLVLLQRTNQERVRGEEITILTLGESTTAPTSYLGEDISWPSQLEEILNKEHKDMKFVVINKAVPGTNTELILDDIEENLDEYKPDIVIAMMGVNDTAGIAMFGQFLPHEMGSERDIVSKIKDLRTARLIRLLWRYLSENPSEVSERQKVAANKNVSAEVIYEKEYELLLSKASDYYRGKYGDGDRDLANAEKLALTAIGKYPNYFDAYDFLFHLYQYDEKYKRAVNVMEDALKSTDNDSVVYSNLGHAYLGVGDLEQAEFYFNKAQEGGKELVEVYAGLAEIRFRETDYKEAETLLMKALQIDPGHQTSLSKLGEVYKKLGQTSKQRNLYSEVPTETSPTSRNYRKIIEKVINSGAHFVAVQYPTVKLYKLTSLLLPGSNSVLGASSDSRLHFVSNEENFDEALGQYRYEDLFSDNFGGTFGHTTDLGSRILAERIADAIKDEILFR